MNCHFEGGNQSARIRIGLRQEAIAQVEFFQQAGYRLEKIGQVRMTI
jgi:hypothetical protein